QFRKDLPAGLSAILRKTLAKRPEDRYQTPVEVAAAIASLGTERSVSRWRRWWGPARKPRWRLGGASGLPLIAFTPLLLLRLVSSASLDQLAEGRFPGQPREVVAVLGQAGTPAVRSVAFNRAGLLATAGDNKLIHVWDPATGKEKLVLQGHGGEVRCV